MEELIDYKNPVTQEPESQKLNKTKPRAIICKASDKDLRTIKKLLKAQFPNVEILYITSAPPATILRVVKTIPLEKQNNFAQPFYTIE